MSQLEKILALVRSINEDEFQEQLTYGDSLDDVYQELLFLAEKIESKKRRTAIIVEHISNCFAGDFFNYLPISEAHDELDVFCMGFNTYIEELKSAMVSRGLLETINEKLVKEKERSEQLALSRNQFLSNMNHEIRTPLNAILGFTNLLLNSSPISPDQKTQLQYLKMSGDILLVIIDDILDLAKMESRQVEFSNKPFNLSQLTRLVHETFLTKVQQKRIDFKISIDKEVPAVLTGDSIRVTQILFNLISNSIKSTPEKGKVRLKIKFQVEEKDFYFVKFSVIDSGIGIFGAKLDSALNHLIQENDTVDPGVGLAIVQKTVSVMGGTFQIKNKAGVETKYIVTLPFLKGY